MVEGERLILRIPTEEDEKDILEMVKEFNDNSENQIPGSGAIEDFVSYKEWLEKNKAKSKKETLPEGRVLGTQFISVRKSDNKNYWFCEFKT